MPWSYSCIPSKHLIYPARTDHKKAQSFRCPFQHWKTRSEVQESSSRSDDALHHRTELSPTPHPSHRALIRDGQNFRPLRIQRRTESVSLLSLFDLFDQFTKRLGKFNHVSICVLFIDDLIDCVGIILIQMNAGDFFK